MRNPARDPNDLPNKPVTNQEETAFENPATDPGFEPISEQKGDDDLEINKTDSDQDALNYKNDRDNGAYNPNII